MVKKTYDAPNKIISGLNLIIGKKLRVVSFLPITVFAGGTGFGSRLITTDKALQDALEKHPMYGRNYICIKEEIIEDEPIEEEKTEENDATEEENKQEDLSGMIHVPVSSPADAREYLHENYNVELKSVWKKAELIAKAKSLNIVFEGI